MHSTEWWLIVLALVALGCLIAGFFCGCEYRRWFTSTYDIDLTPEPLKTRTRIGA